MWRTWSCSSTCTTCCKSNTLENCSSTSHRDLCTCDVLLTGWDRISRSHCWALWGAFGVTGGNTLISCAQTGFGIKTWSVCPSEGLTVAVVVSCLRMVCLLRTVVKCMARSAARWGSSARPRSGLSPLWLGAVHTWWGLTSGAEAASALTGSVEEVDRKTWVYSSMVIGGSGACCERERQPFG